MAFTLNRIFRVSLLGGGGALVLLLSLLQLPAWSKTPDFWPSPARKFSRGFLLVLSPNREEWVEGILHCREGLKRFPGYGPGWLCIGVAIQRWLGDEAALPLFELAFTLDPYGSGVKAFALPFLLRAGKIGVTRVVPHLLYPVPPHSLVLSLPEEPPESWLHPPAPYSPAFLEPFLIHKRWFWLSSLLEKPEILSSLSPSSLALAWFAFCQVKGAHLCERLWKQCTKNEDPCIQGLEPRADHLFFLAERFLASRNLTFAEELARAAFKADPSAKHRDLLKAILTDEGKTREALQLRALRIPAQ